MLAAIGGVGAAGSAIGTGGPWHGHPLALAIGLEILLGLLLLSLTALAMRSPEPGHLRTQLRYLLRWATIVMMIVIVVIGFANYVATRHGSSMLKLLHNYAKGARKSPPQHPHRALHGLDLTYLVYALIAIGLLAAIAACVLVVARHRPASRSLFGEVEPQDDDGASLRQAVESGRAALHEVDEARAAIIACYLAMERSLASAGTARAAAETPDELLARATASGLLRRPAASRLTALFYEARFSTHPLSATAKTDATYALNEISAELTPAGPIIGATPGKTPL